MNAVFQFDYHLLQIYAAWETDEVIGYELWRNLGLALGCVFVITLALLANIPICLMVLLCVALTLVSHPSIYLLINKVLMQISSWEIIFATLLNLSIKMTILRAKDF